MREAITFVGSYWAMALKAAVAVAMAEMVKWLKMTCFQEVVKIELTLQHWRIMNKVAGRKSMYTSIHYWWCWQNDEQEY
jgi:hypothetical protein